MPEAKAKDPMRINMGMTAGIGGKGVKDILGQKAEGRSRAGKIGKAEKTHKGHGKSDRHPEKKKEEGEDQYRQYP